MIRAATPGDTPALVALAVSTGLFLPHEADALLRGVLDELHAGRLGEDHLAYVWVDGLAGPPAGWVYFSRNAMANQIWDLLLILCAMARALAMSCCVSSKLTCNRPEAGSCSSRPVPSPSWTGPGSSMPNGGIPRAVKYQTFMPMETTR